MEHHLSYAQILIISACSLSCQKAVSETVSTHQLPATVTITVDPQMTRSIAGESELDRKRYFSICDSGEDFDKRVHNPERYKQLVNDLRINFGRQLGPVAWTAKNQSIVREDAKRPGFADSKTLLEKLSANRTSQSGRMLSDFGPNLDVAAHGNHGAFPEFMGRFLSETLKKEPPAPGKKSEHLPENIQAAAELSAAIFKYNYDDFTRPRYYEPVNEPHWSYLTDPKHIADWHLATMERMHAEVPGVLIGGPCNAVGNLFGNGYRSFTGMKNFIDATHCQMDFYSFHVYDYYKWQGSDFGGTMLSGLPLEGVLDLIPNYTTITYGHGTPIVVSEHGGYMNSDASLKQHEQIEKLAATLIPGSGFEWQMKARSIHEFIQTNSTIANTLTFMDHPQTVKKAVPFMLLDCSRWDPHYYASLFVPENFDPKSKNFVPTTLLDFYRLFRDVQGRRVKASCNDPDIQTRAFVDGNELYIVAHNLSAKPETLGISTMDPDTVKVRRYGRNTDLTPYLRDQCDASLPSIPLAANETVVVTATYKAPIESKRTLEETVHYGQAVTIPVDKEARITIPIEDPAGLNYASLRIGLNRPSGSSQEIHVLLNGTELKFPHEDSAPRYDNEKLGYSTTRIVSVDPSLLRATNTLAVSFPDGGKGMIGSAVIRTAK